VGALATPHFWLVVSTWDSLLLLLHAVSRDLWNNHPLMRDKEALIPYFSSPFWQLEMFGLVDSGKFEHLFCHLGRLFPLTPSASSLLDVMPPLLFAAIDFPLFSFVSVFFSPWFLDSWPMRILYRPACTWGAL